ncbi:hypothetical protein [Streptomyces sp. SP17KL33]|uniref:hypothetical protein n=1 Tax=Streptomyces sp. SP17KL33 TaxID=3002534 RepID=UPI002E79E509|nr:hypothetical protein [Streptomyces sp. SP17KL33]MEE1837676.1 hypothetical protein [Streptomyces sp. SP17KL33]
MEHRGRGHRQHGVICSVDVGLARRRIVDPEGLRIGTVEAGPPDAATDRPPTAAVRPFGQDRWPGPDRSPAGLPMSRRPKPLVVNGIGGDMLPMA